MRRTYHYDPVTKRMVEGPGQRKTHSGDGWLFSDRLHSANPFVGKDGELITSRKQHREYMRKHGLTTMDDYTNEWQKAAERRADHYTTGGDHRERRDDIGRAIHKLEKP